jgi:tetratricopeptide (TPR) repeat protein/CHAT domain-containing protein
MFHFCAYPPRIGISILSLLLFACAASGQTTSRFDGREVLSGNAVEHQIRAEDKHEYAFHLRKGQVLSVDLVELDFNARLELAAAQDSTVLAVSDMGGGFEREAMTFAIPESGNYLLTVSAGESETDSGAYRLTVRTHERATANDQERGNAEQLFASAFILNKEGTPDRIREAIGKWEQALALWRRVGDRYWEAHTLTRLASANQMLLNTTKALSYFEQSLSISRELGDKRIEALRLIELATAIAATDRQKSTELCSRGLDLFKESGSKLGMAMSLYRLADNSRQAGDKAKAREYLDEALRLAREAQSKGWEANSLYGVGLVAEAQDEKTQALVFYDRALGGWTVTKNERGQALAHSATGKIYLAQNLPEKALSHLEQAVALYRSTRNKVQEGLVLNDIAVAYEKLGRAEERIKALETGIRIWHELKVGTLEISQSSLIASQYLAAGNYKKALKQAELTLAIEETMPAGWAEAQRKTSEHQMKQNKALALNVIATSNYNLGDLDSALGYWDEALAWFVKEQDKTSKTVAAGILRLVAQVHRDRYEWEAALEGYNRALAMAKELDSKGDIASTLNNLGMTYNSVGEKAKAKEYFEQSLAVIRSIASKSKQERRTEASTLDNLGFVCAFLGEPQKALEHYRQSVAAWREINEPTFIDGESATYLNMALIYLGLGEKKTALDLLNKALDMFRRVPPHIRSLARNRTSEARILNAIGTTYSDLGEMQQALDKYDQALKQVVEAHDKDLEGTVRNNIGNVYAHLGDNQRALAYLNEALTLHKISRDKNGEATTLNNISQVYSTAGEHRKALDYLRQVLSLWRSLGNRSGQALALNNIGSNYSALDDKETAIGYYDQALQIFASLSSKDGEATTLNNIALVHSFRGENDKALEHLDRALAICKATGARVGEATALDNIGSVYQQLGESRKALEYYNQALAIRRAIGDKDGEAASLGKLGILRSALGDKRKALHYLDEALTIARSIGNKRFEAVALDSIGAVRSDLGEQERALSLHQQALALDRSIGNRDGEGRSLNNLATLYRSLGETDKAFSHLRRALEISQEIGARQSEALELSNLAVFYSETGERGKALELDRQALAIARAIGSKSTEAPILNELGWDYLELGDSQKALEYREKSLKLGRQTGEKGDQVTALLGLGSLHLEMGERNKQPERFRLALDSYEEALRLSREIEDKSTEAAALTGIGRVYASTNRAERAVESLNASLQLAQAYQSPLQQAATHRWLGTVYERTGAQERAAVEYQQSLSIARSVSDRDDEAKALRGLMSAWKSAGNDEMAILYGKQAVNAFQRLRSAIGTVERKLQNSYRVKVTDVYRELADLLISQGRLAEAQAVLDLLKEEEFKQLVARGAPPLFIVPFNPAEHAVVKILDDLAALSNELEELKAKQARTDAETRRYNTLSETEIPNLNKALAPAIDRLKAASPALHAILGSIKNSDVQDLLADLGKGTVALYTLVGAQASGPARARARRSGIGWVLLVTPGFRKAYPIDTYGLNDAISRFQRALSSPQYDPRALADDLYRRLFRQSSTRRGSTLEADLESYLASAPDKTLMWSLDGVLRYIPMAALHDGKRYLVEKYRNVIFNPKSIARLGHAPTPDWRVLGLGVSQPQTVTSLDGNALRFDPLLGAEQEIRALIRDRSAAARSEGILPGEIKMNSAFTKEALLGIPLTRPPVVHIATHYWYDVANPAMSFLLLGDGNRLAAAEFHDLPNLFRDVDLLSLSACDTAVPSGSGDRDGVEEEGFAYQAQELGARSVVASLWKVSDEATKWLMLKFYEIKRDSPQTPKGEALRQAQLALLRGQYKPGTTVQTDRAPVALGAANPGGLTPFKPDPDAPYAHPYYWAPFVLIGNWK